MEHRLISSKKNSAYGDYGTMLDEAICYATKADALLQDLFLIEDYCGSYQQVRDCLSTFHSLAGELLNVSGDLLKCFQPRYFNCVDKSYLCLLRPATSSSCNERLAAYMLTLDICESPQQLRFFIQSLNHLYIDISKNLNCLHFAHSEYRKECS